MSRNSECERYGQADEDRTFVTQLALCSDMYIHGRESKVK